jgi:hypothetical protein
VTAIGTTDLIGDKDVLLISFITETVRRRTFSNAIHLNNGNRIASRDSIASRRTEKQVVVCLWFLLFPTCHCSAKM